MNESTSIRFSKQNHFWTDSGLLGLYLNLIECNTSEEIAISNHDDMGFTLAGPEKKIISILQRAYEKVVDKHYNVSTEKQKSEKTNYGFFFNSSTSKFESFPKKKSQGIASLIFDKAARPVNPRKQIKWKKKKAGLLPDSHSHLQAELENFLAKSKLKPGPPAGLLVDGPNRVSPKICLPKKLGDGQLRCFLCGKASVLLEEAKETIFPLITGSSGVLSFNSGTRGPEKICWQCSLLGKFVPVNGFYYITGETLFAFFPYSYDFLKMCEIYIPLHSIEPDVPNGFRNFEHPLGGYFQRPYELTFAFLYTLYQKVLQRKISEVNTELDLERLFEIVINSSPLIFYVIAAVKKGNTWMTSFSWAFDDAVYFFRLMDELETAGMKTKQFMTLLIDFEQKKNENKTLVRERVCERILKRQPVLMFVEDHCYRLCKSNTQNIRPLFNLVVHYEQINRKEVNMTIDEQTIAVNLGKQIGHTLGREQKETGGGKGDLYRLRKVRKKIEFLNELERLLQKYHDLKISNEILTGKLSDDNFLEFKHFCTLSALNSFNAVASSTNPAQPVNP